MSTTRPPVWVVASDDQLPPDRGLVSDGWTARKGFELPDSPWDLSTRRWVCIGEVRDSDGATGAIEALTRGVALSIAIDLTGDERRRFEEDLARTGDPAIDHGLAATDLTTEHVALLDGLAAGLSVTAAAAQANLSRRTANRRLAEARVRLGVGSTAEAVTRWVSRTQPQVQPDS